MNLKDLEYFHQLVQLQSFTKVANKLKVTQPTVTYAIKRLEEELNTPLLIRDQAHHSITITAAGKILDTHVEAVLRELAVARIEINKLNHKKVDLGLPPIIGNYYFPKISVFLFQRNLMNDVNIINGGSQDMHQLLKTGRLDMALVGSTKPIIDEYLTTELLTDKRFMIVVSPNHPLARRKSIAFAELEKESFVLFNEHYVHPEGFSAMAKQAHFTPKVVYQNSDLNILKGMIKEQVGIGFLTEIAIDEKDDLVAIPLEDYPQPRFLISLVQGKKAIQSPIQEEIADLIRHSNF